MSPGSRCDELIRLIDEVLAEVDASAADAVAGDAGPAAEGIEEPPGHWGVYYLRPSA